MLAVLLYPAFWLLSFLIARNPVPILPVLYLAGGSLPIAVLLPGLSYLLWAGPWLWNGVPSRSRTLGALAVVVVLNLAFHAIARGPGQNAYAGGELLRQGAAHAAFLLLILRQLWNWPEDERPFHSLITNWLIAVYAFSRFTNQPWE